MSEPVLVDAQVTFPKILKPIPNFEQIYQGADPLRPIAFPGGLDPASEQNLAGYAPNLQKGVEVPFGARLTIWLPNMPNSPRGTYRYKFIWRLRNVVDYARVRQSYHLPDQNPGVPDTSSGTPQARLIQVAGSQCIIYEQAEPVDPAGVPPVGGRVNLRNQWFVPLGGLLETLAPYDGAGASTILSQGVLDPATSPAANYPIFNVFRCDAEGDELIILCQRVDQTNNWDFIIGDDVGFADFYGTGGGKHAIAPNLGIYVFSGTNP